MSSPGYDLPQPPASFRAVLRQREFGALFVAHLLSLLGDRVATVAITVLVFDRSGSVLLAAAAYATSLLPWLLGAPFLAALSDRWPRRRVMLTCDVSRAILVLVLALPGLSIPPLLVLLTAVAWLGPPFEAARAATLPVVLPSEQQYVSASALTMLSNQATQVLGLAAGGLLLTVLTTRQALLLDCVSFLASAVIIRAFLATRPAVQSGDEGTDRPGVWRSVVDGARLTFGDPVLRAVLLLAWLVAAVTVLPEGLSVAFARRLGARSYVTGVLMAAVPAGAALGAVGLNRLDSRVRARCMLPLSAAGLGALAASATAGSWPVLFVAWLLVGMGASVQLPASAVFMRSLPDAFRARGYGLAQTGLMAGQGLALIAAGAGAELVGVPSLLFLAGGLGLLLLGLLTMRWPSALTPASPQTRTWSWSWTSLSPIDAWIGIVTLTAAVSVTAQLVWFDARPAPWRLPAWLLVAVFFATGSYVAKIRIGRQAHVFQLDDIPRLVGLLFVSPATLIVARLVGAALALVLVRRSRGRKLVFNMASFTLEVTVALSTFELLDPGGGVGPQIWPAALAATVAADLVSAWTVGVVIGLAEGDLRLRRVLSPDRMALGTALAAATVGMIAVTTLWFAPSSGSLILVLVVLGMLGLRAFAKLSAEGRQQQALQAVLSELGNLEPDEQSLRRSLETIRDLMAVDVLECWVSPVQDGPPSGWFTVQAEGNEVSLDPPTRDRLAVRCLESLSDDHPRLPWDGSRAPEVIAEPSLRHRWWRRQAPGVQHLAVALPGERPSAITADLPNAQTAIGALVVSAPIGDGRTFNGADVEQLQTIAGMLSQALRRVEQRHELHLNASQDRLTGLATLQEFRRHVGSLLDSGVVTAFLMINLDRLRAVNDVFGRDTGDRVIAAAAQRTRRLAPAGSVLARVSGHHFACAFPTDGAGSIAALARRLRGELEQPLAAEGVDAEVGVHIGISLSPDHGEDPDVLLRRAETAGDAAKEDPFGVAVFVHDLEQDVARPLRLVRDLRAALERTDQLSLHYQPKQSLLTGDILGCEALLRWKHPELGNVPPDEFIGLAESTGLITEITAFTLDEALRQSARWERQGLPSAVAVNLSARNLLDGDLVQRVSDALSRNGVEPGQLTLEITETSVMAQPMRSVLMLDALSELGVQLSIDDFGTGYSNLIYLRQLPVQEVKIDRTFLSPVGGEPPLGQGGVRAFEFLRHAIALVHSLGLYVVVEGVEDEMSLDALQVLGADSVQGYFVCRPIPAEELSVWMTARDPSSDALDPPRGS